MKNKYGIIQSTSTSCSFYKQDSDGNQSTFNIFVAPKMDEEEKKSIFAFIDNEQIKQKSWFGTNDVEVKDVVQAFREWASDAPFMFELDAQKSMGECLGSKLKKTNENE